MTFLRLLSAAAAALLVAGIAGAQAPYAGKPFSGTRQMIPGRVQAEFYDIGGEGVGFHDSDAVNSGSGTLNQGAAAVDRFRKDEAVDISYIKAGIDKTVDGEDEKAGELYVGWTAPGEWVRYSVEVAKSGTYIVNAHISSRFDDAEIAIAVDGVSRTGPIAVPTTTHWHKWMVAERLAEMNLEKGPHVLSLEFLKQGNMNVDYLEFVPKEEFRPRATTIAAADRRAYEQVRRIRRCVNVLGYDPIWDKPAKARFQEKDFRLIREAGFEAIRVNLQALNRMDAGLRLSEEWWRTLDWIVKNALANRLAVILDLHNFTDVAEDPARFRPRIMAFWKQMAEHFKDAPDSVLFEVLNEPNGKLTDALWNDYLAEALGIIRASNPTRTVIAGPAFWNNIGHLKDLRLPPEDRNLIVTVHYYTPMEFTHQGAPWSKETAHLSGIAWGTNAEMRAADEDLWKANQWGKENRRPIFLGEFGAYDKAAMESRVRYTSYLARTAETLGWGWGYWQFDSDFIVYNIEKHEWVEPIRRALIP